MTKQSHYNVGIYVRLSQEDERAGESISIENQKKMLTEYVSKQTGWNWWRYTRTTAIRVLTSTVRVSRNFSMMRGRER